MSRSKVTELILTPIRPLPASRTIYSGRHFYLFRPCSDLMVISSCTSRAGLSFRTPLKAACRRSLSAVQVVNSLSTTSFGSTQTARFKYSRGTLFIPGGACTDLVGARQCQLPIRARCPGECGSDDVRSVVSPPVDLLADLIDRRLLRWVGSGA